MDIKVKIDSLSRVYIPKQVMDELGWETGNYLLLNVEQDEVILKKKDILKCASCNNLILESYSYCPNCGTNLKDE